MVTKCLLRALFPCGLLILFRSPSYMCILGKASTILGFCSSPQMAFCFICLFMCYLAYVPLLSSSLIGVPILSPQSICNCLLYFTLLGKSIPACPFPTLCLTSVVLQIVHWLSILDLIANISENIQFCLSDIPYLFYLIHVDFFPSSIHLLSNFIF